MRRTLVLAMLVIMLSCLLSGCITSRETDDVAYVVVFGIDKAEQNKLKLTFQLIVPRAVGGEGGGKDGGDNSPWITNSITAANIAEAYNLLNSTMSRYPALLHTKAILIGEDLARSGVGDVLGPLLRYREYRGNIFVCVVRGKAGEFIENNKPRLDFLPTKFYESFMLSANETSYYPPSDVHEFYLKMKNPGGSSYAAYIGLNPRNDEDKSPGEKVPNNKSEGYLPGEIPRTGTEGPAEFIGTAVFSGVRMVGTLDSQETRILAMLQDHFTHGFYAVADPLEPGKKVNAMMRNGAKPKINVNIIDGREVISIHVFLEGDISSIPSGINYEMGEYKELLETEISAIVTQQIQGFIRHTQELGSDVVGFGYYLRPKFATYDELEKTNLEELYKSAEISVKVDTKIRRAGLMWRSSPYKLQSNPF